MIVRASNSRTTHRAGVHQGRRPVRWSRWAVGLARVVVHTTALYFEPAVNRLQNDQEYRAALH